MSTFGESLLHYTETAHSVSTDEYFSLLQMIRGHLEDDLEASFFAVVIQRNVYHGGQLQSHLIAEFPKEPEWWDAVVVTKDGQYSCQAALAYSRARPIWVVASDGGYLDSAPGYHDLLGMKDESIPKYAHIPETGRAQTSIILPLKLDERPPFGVMNIESKSYQKRSDSTLRELERIGKAISALRYTKEVTDLRSRRTQEARNRLIEGGFAAVFGNPYMFLAYSQRAENGVMGTIRSVLDKVKLEFDLADWREPVEGNIHENIWRNISRSKLAVCYLSEPSNVAPHRYQDNPNVLLEAGMAFALRQSAQGPMQGVLLIREPDSPPTPFNIAAESMLMVPRLEDGRLNVDQLLADLAARLARMLSPHHRRAAGAADH